MILMHGKLYFRFYGFSVRLLCLLREDSAASPRKWFLNYGRFCIYSFILNWISCLWEPSRQFHRSLLSRSTLQLVCYCLNGLSILAICNSTMSGFKFGMFLLQYIILILPLQIWFPHHTDEKKFGPIPSPHCVREPGKGVTP